MSDTGHGMDADARAGMFDPFYTTKTGKGRGLGATVAYEAVMAHGGHVEVNSSPGSGTCVDVYFPAVV